MSADVRSAGGLQDAGRKQQHAWLTDRATVEGSQVWNPIHSFGSLSYAGAAQQHSHEHVHLVRQVCR